MILRNPVHSDEPKTGQYFKWTITSDTDESEEDGDASD
jgi:hypothetical protein